MEEEKHETKAQGYIPVRTQSPEGRKALLIWSLISALILAAAVLAVAFSIAPAALYDSTQYGARPFPMIAEREGEVWLLSGGNAQSLGKDVHHMRPPYKNTMRGKIPSIISADNRYIYYITDYDRSTGAGTLMIADTDARHEPIKVSDRVCAAAASADGKSALFITDIRENEGKLWLYEGARPSLVAKSAYHKGFGLSPEGKSCYYFSRQNERYVLSICSEKEHQTVCDVSSVDSYNIFLDDKGRMLYNVDSDTLKLYSDGECEQIAYDAWLLCVLNGTDSYIYSKGSSGKQTLYYKARRKDPEKLYESDGWIYPVNARMYLEQQDGLLFIEHSYDSNLCSLFEFIPGRDGGFMPVAEDIEKYRYTFSRDFCRAAYIKDRSVYIAQKEDGEWSEPHRICRGSGRLQFDETGGMLYWLDEGTDILWRIDFQSGSKEQISQGAELFLVSAGAPYTVSRSGTVLRGGPKAQLMLENAYTPLERNIRIEIMSSNGYSSHYFNETGYTLMQTPGGAYVLTQDKDIVFLPAAGAGTTLLEGECGLLYPSYYLNHLMPDRAPEYGIIPYEVLTDKDEESLRAMYEDMLYYKQLILGKAGYDTSHGKPEDNEALANQILNRDNLPADAMNTAQWFGDAFSQIGNWIKNKDQTYIKESALSNIGYAAYYFEQYLGVD